MLKVIIGMCFSNWFKMRLSPRLGKDSFEAIVVGENGGRRTSSGYETIWEIKAEMGENTDILDTFLQAVISSGGSNS